MVQIRRLVKYFDRAEMMRGFRPTKKGLLYLILAVVFGAVLPFIGDPPPPSDELLVYLENAGSRSIIVTVSVGSWSEMTEVAAGGFKVVGDRGLADEITQKPGTLDVIVRSDRAQMKRWILQIRADGRPHMHWLALAIDGKGGLKITEEIGVEATEPALGGKVL